MICNECGNDIGVVSHKSMCSDYRHPPAPGERGKAKSALIQIAGTLLTRSKLPSEFADDYPQKTYAANVVAKMMEPAHDQLRLLAIQIRNIADSL